MTFHCHPHRQGKPIVPSTELRIWFSTSFNDTVTNIWKFTFNDRVPSINKGNEQSPTNMTPSKMFEACSIHENRERIERLIQHSTNGLWDPCTARHAVSAGADPNRNYCKGYHKKILRWSHESCFGVQLLR